MRWSQLAWLTVAACGAPTMSNQSSSTDARAEDARVISSDAAVDGHLGDYRSSLSVCWMDASCPRVMAVAHGGSWDTSSAPYLSNAALEAAFAAGDEGVKIDVRFTKDGVPVLAHSSPIEYFESLDCANKKVEDMTVAQVTSCHRFPSTTQKFQRLDDVLAYLRGKMVVQLCVKRSVDLGATVAAVHALGAEDFAFIEITAGDFTTLGPSLPATAGVQFLVNVASQLADIPGVLALTAPHAFMIEIDPGVDIGTLVSTQLHPAGVRAFVYDNAASPTTAQLQAHYERGFDVVSSQSGPRGVEARVAVNQARGITPP